MIRNVNHNLIMNKLDDLLATNDCCKCDKCKDDIIAYALNQLPAKYVSTDVGELYGRANAAGMQSDIDIVRVLAMAIDVVGKNPRHEKND